MHGAWADGSSWSAVTKRLQREGYTVDVEPNPLRGVASDAQYLRDYLAVIIGPIVLVAHSYGGMVITSAATGNANVKALVYVDAYIPQDGDTLAGLTGAQPGSLLDPNSSVIAVPQHNAAGQVVGADVYVKPAQFPAIFAAGIPAKKATELAASQRPLAFGALTEVFTGVPAWQSIPSWDLIGTADKLVPPGRAADHGHPGPRARRQSQRTPPVDGRRPERGHRAYHHRRRPALTHRRALGQSCRPSARHDQHNRNRERRDKIGERR